MKKYLSLIRIIFIALVLSIGIKYVFAFSRPSSAPNSDVSVIHAGGDQYLSSKLGIGVTSLNSTYTDLGLEVGYPIIAAGLELTKKTVGATTTGGNLFVQGTITSIGLKNTATATSLNICADTNGKLVKC